MQPIEIQMLLDLLDHRFIETGCLHFALLMFADSCRIAVSCENPICPTGNNIAETRSFHVFAVGDFRRSDHVQLRAVLLGDLYEYLLRVVRIDHLSPYVPNEVLADKGNLGCEPFRPLKEFCPQADFNQHQSTGTCSIR